MPLDEFGERHRAVYAVIDLIAFHVDTAFVTEVKRAERKYAAPMVDHDPLCDFTGDPLAFIIMPYLVFVHSNRNGGRIDAKGREKRGLVDDGYLLEMLGPCVNVCAHITDHPDREAERKEDHRAERRLLRRR